MIVEIPLISHDSAMLGHWFVGMSLLCGLYALSLGFTFGKWPVASFLYFAISSLWIFMCPESQYANEPFIYVPIAYLSAAFFAVMVLMTAFASVIDYDSPAMRACRIGIGYFAILNAVYVICGFISGDGKLRFGVGYSGWLDYSGMNGSLIAVTSAFLYPIKKYRLWGWVACLIAVILSKSSIPFGVLFVVMAALGFHIGSPLALGAAAMLPAVGLLSEGRTLFDSGSRLQAYKTFMGAWWHNSSAIFGAGPGSFHVVERYIQEATGFMKGFWWPTMHSDWLQTLFESGAIGLFLVGMTALDICRRLYKHGRPEVFAAFCGLIACALFDYPFRYFEFSFIGIIAVMEAYRGAQWQRTS